jgi:UDP-N-acetyl-D-mannosaminuronic acid dehydrogenase
VFRPFPDKAADPVMQSYDVTIVGGCGRVGLPLGLAFALRGLQVALYDVRTDAVESVNAGRMPFVEPGAPEALAATRASGLLEATLDRAAVRRAECVVVVIGTPIDEHLNPDLGAVHTAIEEIADCLSDGQLLILRSTVYPGVTAVVERLILRLGLDIDVAFCPERIAEGKALEELAELPQIVAARSDRAIERATKLFRNLTEEVVYLSPEEAELAKLFTNAWRYIKFAAANQLFMMANDFGIDYERVRYAVRYNYPRAADLPGAGFAAGPCLFKDTMQLAAFNRNNFVLGHSAMLINEGLPLYLVSRLEERFKLGELTVGILGMAFKGGSDDPRESLAYKLRKILSLKTRETLCTDPHIVDARFTPLDEVLKRADLLVIASPHAEYAALDTDLPVVDMWGLTGQGVRV